jgi:ACS family glucarate transporter-like MFS transporter
MNTTPSTARHVVIAFAVTLAVITYIDRVGISVALPLISKELGLTSIQMGWVLSSRFRAAGSATGSVPGAC